MTLRSSSVTTASEKRMKMEDVKREKRKNVIAARENM